MYVCCAVWREDFSNKYLLWFLLLEYGVYFLQRLSLEMYTPRKII